MSKSIFAMMLAAVLIFSTFGCGGQESSSTAPVEEAAETMEGMEGSDMKAMEDAKAEAEKAVEAEAEKAAEIMEGSEAK